MANFPWRSIYAWLLAAFFTLGGALNITASPDIVADYARWGYPDGFYYLTGILEWTTALLIAWPRFRLIGSLLGAAIMGAATMTVLLAGEISHAVPPVIVLVLVLVNARLSAKGERLDGVTRSR